jgi:ComF family protein
MDTRISFWHRVLNLISPQACVICGCRLGISEEVMCTPCNLALPRTGFAQQPYDNEMAKRFYGRLPIERAAALFYYEAGSEASRIIHAMKYFHHPEIGRIMGRMMAEEMSPHHFFDGVDALVPVPLAKKRQRERGYNQSEEIAKGVSEVTGIHVETGIVRRKHFESSQTNKTQAQRLSNVENSFELVDATKASGKHLLIIDDIVTTGSTIWACSRPVTEICNCRISVLSIGVVRA